jgi:hypothetical protein
MNANRRPENEVTYPPEPWDLQGLGYVSLWLVPTRVLPALPDGVQPVSVLGKSVVATGFVDYQPGGLLPYHEFLAAPLVHKGATVGLSITDIWVDSPASKAGGRELWGIPKELADFEITHAPAFHGVARVEGEAVAEARVAPRRAGLRLPFPLPGTIWQTLDATLARTPLRATGKVHLAQGNWRVGGPLAWLRPYRPFLTIAAVDFGLRFGPRRR